MSSALHWTDRIGRRIKLRDLHILMAVAQAGSMGKAAEALSVSQPVVSKSVAALEEALGKPLLDRGPHGVVPTLYGRALLESSTAVFDDLRQAVDNIDHLADPATGELRIGCTEPGAIGFVPLVIERIARLHPQATFRVVTADPVALVERELRGRTVDLAIGAMIGVMDADIEQQLLFTDRHVVMAGPGNRWLRRRDVRLSDLIDERWVLPPPDSFGGRHVGAAFAAAGLALPRRRTFTLSIALTQSLLATGHHLGILPTTMARLRRPAAPAVVAVAFPAIVRPVSIVTLAHRTLGPLARLFIDTARTMAGEWIDRIGLEPAPPASRTPGTIAPARPPRPPARARRR